MKMIIPIKLVMFWGLSSINYDRKNRRMGRTEEDILHLTEQVIIAQENSMSEWAINYWTVILNRLKVRYPSNGK